MAYIFLLLCVVLFVWLKLNAAWIKGTLGERFVRSKLASLDRSHYTIINDLLLPSLGRLATTQIDHVVVSTYGIFCIETKDYRGWIFGSKYNQNWTQVIYHSKKSFYNPLRQNFAHVKALESLIWPTHPNVPIFPFVIFPSAERLEVIGTDAVGSAYDIVEKIKAYKHEVLSDTERTVIVHILTTANRVDKEDRRAHDRGAHRLRSESV